MDQAAAGGVAVWGIFSWHCLSVSITRVLLLTIITTVHLSSDGCVPEDITVMLSFSYGPKSPRKCFKQFVESTP